MFARKPSIFKTLWFDGLFAPARWKEPYVGVMHRPISSFIYAGKGSDARAVLVNGDIVYRDNAFTRFPERTRAVSEAERIGRQVLAKAGLSARLEPASRR